MLRKISKRQENRFIACGSVLPFHIIGQRGKLFLTFPKRQSSVSICDEVYTYLKFQPQNIKTHHNKKVTMTTISTQINKH